MASDGPKETAPKLQLGHGSTYAEYNKTLRTWLVSFGISVPAVLLVNPTLLETLKRSGLAECVIGLFIAGCAFQIAMAFLNKTIAYYMYLGEMNEPFKARWQYRTSRKLGEWYWVDFMLDLASLVSFGFAIFLMFVDLDAGVEVSRPMPR